MSSVKKVIKNDYVKIKGKISLSKSQYDNVVSLRNLSNERDNVVDINIVKAKEEYENIISKYEEEGLAIVENAKKKAEALEKQGYESGYNQGLKNGYEDGYKESYESNIEKAKEESEKIKNEAYNTLLYINNEVNNYMKDNSENILKVSIAIAEQVLRTKFEEFTTMSEMLEITIKEHSLKKTVIIKVNPIYTENLQEKMNEIVKESNLCNEIFIIPDSTIEKGNAEIEMENGKLLVGIDSVLEKVKQELC